MTGTCKFCSAVITGNLLSAAPHAAALAALQLTAAQREQLMLVEAIVLHHSRHHPEQAAFMAFAVGCFSQLMPLLTVESTEAGWTERLSADKARVLQMLEGPRRSVPGVRETPIPV